MSSYVFQFFCGDGKVGTGGSGQQGREMLSLQAPPPRPRPSSVPMRPLHSSGEHNESRFEQPVVRDRRRRAHSRSVSRHRHRRARSPRRKRRTRTPAQSRQAGPLEPNPGSDGSATTASFTSPTLHATAQARAYVRSARMVSSAYAMASCAFSTASTAAAVYKAIGCSTGTATTNAGQPSAPA